MDTDENYLYVTDISTVQDLPLNEVYMVVIANSLAEMTVKYYNKTGNKPRVVYQCRNKYFVREEQVEQSDLND